MYAKSLEAQERQTYERKQALKDALGSGKQLPTELRKHASALGRDLPFDEAQAGAHICSCTPTLLIHYRPYFAHRQ